MTTHQQRKEIAKRQRTEATERNDADPDLRLRRANRQKAQRGRRSVPKGYSHETRGKQRSLKLS